MVPMAFSLLLHAAVAAAAPSSTFSKRLLSGVVQALPTRLEALNYVDPPRLDITRAPKAQVVAEGDRVSLTCEATAIPPPVIEWTFEGRVVQKDALDLDLENLLNMDLQTVSFGVSSSRLSLGCVTAAEAGRYACVASNGLATVSAEAGVDVRAGNTLEPCPEEKAAPPTITLWSESRLEREGASAQLVCRARGSPTPKIRWETEDGVRLRNEGPFQVLPSGDLLVTGVDFSLMGGYVCIAENVNGSDKREVFFFPTEREPGMKKGLEPGYVKVDV